MNKNKKGSLKNFYALKKHLRGKKSLIRLFTFLCFLCFLFFLCFWCVQKIFLKKKEFKTALMTSFTLLLIGCPYDTIWDHYDWEPTVITATLCSSANLQEPSGFIYPSTKSWNNPGNISLPWSCASVLKSHTHYPELHQPPIEKKPTTISLIIYKHYTH